MLGASRLGLGLDCGGSASRWAICDDAGALIACGELNAVSGHLFDPVSRERFEAMAIALAHAVQAHGVGALLAGITGLTSASPSAVIAAEILSVALSVPQADVRVEDDLWIAYRAVFDPGEGHVVYAGTGSIGMHLFADGRVLRVGGRGMLIDDGGSAFWIGRTALDLVFRKVDEGDAPGALATSLFAAMGGADWNTVRAYVYGDGRNAMAMLARAVATAAHHGDLDALAIMREAGGELARLARVLCRRAGMRPVALLGRAASLHPAIAEGLRAAFTEVDLLMPEINPARAAAQLAAGGA